MIFKFRYRLLGGHVHIRMFAGTNPHALGKCGDLTMRPEEWEHFRLRTRHGGFEFVDDTAVEPRYALPLDMP
jgi:hypothetical protein